MGKGERDRKVGRDDRSAEGRGPKPNLFKGPKSSGNRRVLHHFLNIDLALAPPG